jgi:mannose-1-phosphate guanylyltransferase
VKAVVLVGGEGTRLRPLTYSTPKQLLPMVEVPLLERVLVHLAAAGVDEAVLSLGYRPDAFIAAYPNGVAAGIRLTYAVEPEPLDTAGAIGFAARAAGIDDTFLAVNGDVLTDVDVGELIACHRRHQALATLHLTAVDDPSRFGVVSTDDDGRVLAFVEKPAPGTAPSNLINAGTYVLEAAVLDEIADDRPVSIERETFPALTATGRVFAVASDAYWLDTGTPAAYLQAHADLLSGRRGDPPSPGATAREPGVWTLGTPTIVGDVRPCSLIGSDVRVEAGAVVESSVVGAGSIIEAGAVVRGSVLLPGVRVGLRASVEGSILGRHAVVAEDCVVSALTVVGDNEVLAPGAHLSEARVPA